MKRLLIVSLCVMQLAYGAAYEFTQQELQEVRAHWQALFNDQLTELPEDQRGQALGYVQDILEITPDDTVIAWRLVAHLAQGDYWQEFAEKKDEASTIAFIEYMITTLRLYVAPDTELRFPPRLATLPDIIASVQCSEDKLLQKIRQGLLVVTILASRMSAMSQEA